MAELSIDPEFEAFISPLEDEEYVELTDNILQFGVQDPIKTWNGFIIDGHNRYNILEEQGMLGEGYPTLDMSSELEDKVDVKLWMVKNQLGRRNLTPSKKKYYIGEQYNLNKQKHGTNRFSNVECANAHSTKGKLEEVLAEEHKVSPTTVRDAATFAEAIDIKEETSPGFKQKVFKGEAKMPRAEARELVKKGADRHAKVEAVKKAFEEREGVNLRELREAIPPVALFNVNDYSTTWKELYILMSTLCHPDRGGSHEAQSLLNDMNNYFKSVSRRAKAQAKADALSEKFKKELANAQL